ncbi:unnamed protein product, partial [Pocillopora meandrina]
MIGEQLYCQVPKSLATKYTTVKWPIRLLTLYYIYHFEYPERFRNIYFYLQQFVLGDHKLLCAPRVINSYHESIQSYLVFANS